MWRFGNVFFTEEAAEFAREKKKVEVELERYAKKHNGPTRSDSFTFHITMAGMKNLTMKCGVFADHLERYRSHQNKF